jgi:hypothetical protein
MASGVAAIVQLTLAPHIQAPIPSDSAMFVWFLPLEALIYLRFVDGVTLPGAALPVVGRRIGGDKFGQCEQETAAQGEYKRFVHFAQFGQFGGGVEIRLTPHIGIIHDFNWNVIDGHDNNFGMVRTGISFAF